MKELNNISNIYFIGIGGIGMSALARYFHTQGALVSGYDRTRTALTIELEQSGIVVHYDENINELAKEAQVVVYTPAVPADHKELVWYRENGYNVIKRSDLLQWVTANSFNICVAGTHGKTTTTTMIAHLLRHSGFGCNAFLGGISANYGTNFWSDTNNVVVVEADEYDRSFLKLHPNLAVITAMDPDHLDIYKTQAAFEEAFLQFADVIKDGGRLIVKHNLPRQEGLKAKGCITYHLNDTNADVYTTDLRVVEGTYHYNIQGRNWNIGTLELSMGGLHNVENSIAAIIVAKQLNIPDEKIKAAIKEFKGVRRRFEYILQPGNETGTILIDDYAHHPEELKALISGIRSIYGNEPFSLVFQPHLYTRTLDQADGFAGTLSMADEVILLPIYPARELPIEGVNSQLLQQKMPPGKARVMEKGELLQWVKTRKPGLLVMAGAGDIDAIVQEAKTILKAK